MVSHGLVLSEVEGRWVLFRYARFVAALEVFLCAVAVVVLIAVAARATVFGREAPAEGMLGAATGLAVFQLAFACRMRTSGRHRALALLRYLVFATLSGAACFALDSLLFD